MPDKVRKLFYGDCLDVMRGMIPDESVDLVYLDPPFNSKATYNVLFKPPEELGEAAQIKAFEDTWHWTVQTEREYSEILKNPYGNTDLANLVSALRQFLGENDMLAYLVHMANRLLEIRRVMKPTASIYLHCDPTASHYLKLILDSVLGKSKLRNEVVWCYRRYTAKSKRFQRLHDIIFFYTKEHEYTFNHLYIPYGEKSGKKDSHYKQDEEGRWFRWQKRKGQEPYKIYLKKGVRLGDWWDLPIINASSKERLSYPTQKPLVLLKRIIQASSNEGDVVLDPFCGCGTTVHAAEALKRNWIGIDITHLAINLIRSRLQSAFPGIEIETHGLPVSYAGALELARADKHEFELWVLGELDAMPYKGGRKGADTGIDGYLFFRYLEGKKALDGKAIVEVKGGGTGVKDVGYLDAVVVREGADLGILVSALKPSKKMYEHAAGRGTVTLGTRDYPKLQVIFLKDLMEGRARVEYPESGKIEHTKTAPKHQRKDQLKLGD